MLASFHLLSGLYLFPFHLFSNISRMTQQFPSLNAFAQEESLENLNHSHPYEYLTKLNTIYNNYNRSAVKDYSSASKIKLPFKRFNTIKVPQAFESNYAKQKKQLIQYGSNDENKCDDSQKKLWKEHREIIKKYLVEKQGKKQNNSVRNKEFAEKMLSKDRNNIFLKKIIEKGTKFEYDEKKLQEQVLQKLKNISKPSAKGLIRCQTAKVMSESKTQKIEQNKVDLDKNRISDKEFLEYDNEAILIKRYKGLIKQVDCSISEKSIQKTSDLLKMMHKMVEDTEYL